MLSEKRVKYYRREYIAPIDSADKNTSEKNDTDQKRKLVERDNIEKLNTKSCASQEENFKPYTLKNT